MRISDLSGRSGVPVATIKFYLRQGLLPRGTVTAATQATYGEEHLRRLAFVRALVDLGGLSLRQVRGMVAVIDGSAGSAASALRAGADGSSDAFEPGESEALTEVARFLEGELGWTVDPQHPGRRQLARGLLALRRCGRAADVSIFRPYARAASWLVTEDLEHESGEVDAQRAVVSAVVADAASVALRRLAREQHAPRVVHLPRSRG